MSSYYNLLWLFFPFYSKHCCFYRYIPVYFSVIRKHVEVCLPLFFPLFHHYCYCYCYYYFYYFIVYVL